MLFSTLQSWSRILWLPLTVFKLHIIYDARAIQPEENTSSKLISRFRCLFIGHRITPLPEQISRDDGESQTYMRPSFLSPLSLWSSVNPQNAPRATSWCIVSDYEGRYAYKSDRGNSVRFFSMTGNDRRRPFRSVPRKGSSAG